MSIRSILAPLGILGSLATSTANCETLVVNSYGGPYEAIIQERIIKPFENRYGIDVIYDAVGSAAQDYAKIKATRGRPGFDVVVMTASQSLQGCKDGYLLELNAGIVPNLAKLAPEINRYAGQCGAVHEIQYLSLLYRKDKLGQSPTSWSDLEHDDLDGRVLLPTFQNIMAAYLVQLFSVANGGDLLDNVDAGFEALGRVAGHAKGFEQSSSVMENYIKDGKIWAMPFWSGRAELLVENGVPVDYVRPREGTIPLLATLNVPKGTRNREAALKFVDFFLEKTSQEAWVNAYHVGSARPDIEVDEKVRAKQITRAQDIRQLLLPDLAALSVRLPLWGERWEREVVAASQ